MVTGPCTGLFLRAWDCPDLALGLIELHEFHMRPPLKPVTVPLGAIPTLQHADITQLGVVITAAEGALHLTVPVTNKAVK